MPNTITRADLPAPRSVALPAPGLAERAVVIVVMLLLAFDVPQVWFTAARPGMNGVAGTENQMAIVLVLAGLFAIANAGCDPTRFFAVASTEPLLPMLLVLGALSTFWSAEPSTSLHSSLGLASVALFGYWLVLRFSLTQVIACAAWCFAIATPLHAAMIKLVPEYGSSATGWTGLLKNRNTFGATASCAVIVLVFAARLFPRQRALAWTFAAANFAFVLGTTSKTALVAAVAGPTMMIVFTALRARRTLYAAVVISIVGGAAIVLAVGAQQLPALTEVLNRQSNLSGRTDIWGDVVREITRRPWFGFGLDGFWTDPSGVARGMYLRYATELPHAHNAVLEHALDLGVIGAALVVLIHVRLIVRGARIVRRYSGASGLFPIVFAGWCVLTSITEPGVIARGLPFLLLVVSVGFAGRGRRGPVPDPSVLRPLLPHH